MSLRSLCLCGKSLQLLRLKLQISVLVVLWLALPARAQRNYPLLLKGADKDSAFLVEQFGIPANFATRDACIAYINKLPDLLQAKGYVTASIDTLRYDSAFARLVLYIGEQFRWAQLDARSVDPNLLDIAGWRERMFTGRPIDFEQVAAMQERMLTHLENTGYPFARIWLDSVQLDNENVSALLKVNRGPVYKIDSIRIYGSAKISNSYLQRYLEIPNGSTYNKEKLQRVSRRIRELPYIEEEQPANLTRLGSGSVLNLYLRPKRSSQVNVLFGFLPNNDQLSSKKLLLTGEANINLKNAFGSGETVGVNWQQLQVKSPRLNLAFQYPYLFNSPVGLDFAFDMFRKDSTFVNINMQIGAQYMVNAEQSGKLFLQRIQTIVNGVNKNFILQNRRLGNEADVSSVNVGIDYEYNNTNYRLNPRKGNEIRLITSVGTKKLKKNNEVLELKDPGDPSFDFGTLYDTIRLKTYQFRIKGYVARYFPFGRASTLKTAVNGGIFQNFPER
jgi:outer membrane protein assembly factor BamA